MICNVQGIVGSTPWNAMVFFTLWLQLLGFTDYSASVLMALFALGCAIGSAVGGYLGQSPNAFPAFGKSSLIIRLDMLSQFLICVVLYSTLHL